MRTVIASAFLFSGTLGAAAEAIPEGMCAIVVGARETMSEVHEFIDTHPGLPFEKVYLASNGWFAISTSTIPVHGSTARVSSLIAQGRIPKDSYCSRGKSYKRVALNLRAPGRSPTEPEDEYASLFADFEPATLSWSDKRFLQAALAFEGHYNGLLDGEWGRLSEAAMGRFSAAKFGRASENWHLVPLAISLFDRIEADGWDMRYFDGLGMSFLVPKESLNYEGRSEHFVNYGHSNSTLAISVGIHTRDRASSIHDFTLGQHGVSAEPYTVRKAGLAVTSVSKSDGSILYARSNFIEGAWSTVLVSASGRDKDTLNAVTSSLTVGNAAPLYYTTGGRLENVLKKSAAWVRERENERTAEQAPAPPSKPRSTGEEGAASSGSGFFVSPSGHIMTNAHVVDECTRILVDGNKAEMIALSEAFDLAVLKSKTVDVESYAAFSAAPAGLNADVTAVGYPYGGFLGGLNVTRGSVSSALGLGGDTTRMQITAPVQSGNSGGPLLASDGSVVGVVVSKLSALKVADATGDLPQNVNFAVRGEIAKLFLSQQGISPEISLSEKALEPESLASIASDFTVLIECK